MKATKQPAMNRTTASCLVLGGVLNSANVEATPPMLIAINRCTSVMSSDACNGIALSLSYVAKAMAIV